MTRVATKYRHPTTAGLAGMAYKGARYLAKKVYENREQLSKGSNSRRINPSGHGKNAPKKSKKTVNKENTLASQDVFDLQRSKYKMERKTFLSKAVTIAPPQYGQYADQQTYTGAQGSQYFYTLPRQVCDQNMMEFLNQNATLQTTETQLWLDHVYLQTQITNFSSEVNEITIYELVAKENTTTGYDPVTCIQTGYNAKYNNTAAYLRPYNSPTESQVFNRYWKVDKKIKVVLKPSETHKHQSFYGYKKKWLSAFLNTGSGATKPSILRGWTRTTMIQANGVAVTGSGVSSLSKVEHAVVSIMSLKYYQPQGPSSNQTLGVVTNTLDSVTVMKNDNPFTKGLTNIS